MDFIPIAALLTFVAGYAWFLHRTSRRWLTPLWIAFSMTALGGVLVVAGSVGYRITKSARADFGPWSENVIWWQIGAGVVLLMTVPFLLRLPRWRDGSRLQRHHTTR